jgi:signal transduction histidine kinase
MIYTATILNPMFKSALPLFSSLACAVIASCALLGWALGIGHLTSVFPGLPTMVPMTALLTLAASAALWHQRRAGGASPAWGPAAPAAAGPVPWSAPLSAALRAALRAALPAGLLAAFALAILLVHLAGQAPPPFTLRGGDGPHGGWSVSSPVSAAMFAALGAGLLAMGRPHHVRHGQALALGVLLVALLTLAGYVFRDTFLYQLLPGKGTSILTTVSLILLAAGVLALRPHEGIMVALAGPDPGARIGRRLLLSALTMPLLLGVAAGLLLRLEAIDVGTAIAFLVWGMVVLFTGVVWRAALMLYRIEAARRRAEGEREAAMAALREADANKDDFLALLAHELRNPLAPIRAAAELLRLPRAIDPAQLRRTGDIIGRQADHMAHLVDDLLDASRARRGLITLEKVPVDLYQAVCDAIEQLRPQVAQRRHALQVELGDARPSVLGDHKRLVQVVANLLGNASKYTPEGGIVRVWMRLHQDSVEVAVQDNGIGIDAALLPRVFDSFMQVTRTAGRADGGLGLGLALVRHLAALHEGRIEARSAGTGQGSTFILTLPRLHD